MSDDNNEIPKSEILVEPKLKKLKRREKKLVKLVARDVDNMTALKEAGYHPTNSDSAKNMVSKILRRPHIQNALDAELEKMYPSLTADVATMFSLNAQSALQPDAKPAEREKFIRLVADLRGWMAPKKNVKATFKGVLPKDFTSGGHDDGE